MLVLVYMIMICALQCFLNIEQEAACVYHGNANRTSVIVFVWGNAEHNAESLMLHCQANEDLVNDKCVVEFFCVCSGCAD